jgi:HAD superfamily hydrolase (TIGR01509 family)
MKPVAPVTSTGSAIAGLPIARSCLLRRPAAMPRCYAACAMAKPKALLLDVMETLVHEPFHRAVPAFFSMTSAELIPLLQPGTWVEFELGRIDEATLFERFFRDRRAVDGAGLKAAMVAAYAWLDGMEELLAELDGRGVVMHALSNYPIWYRLIEAKLGLSRYLAWTFVSCKTGVRKPDAEAYLGAARALGVSPEELLFVDDRRSNCAAAEAVGMPSLRFVDAPSLRTALRERGLCD